MEVVIDYDPRDAFKPFHDRTERFSAIVAHRRAGKTVACVHDLNRSALTCPKPKAQLAYIAPYFVQAKDVAWSYLKDAAAPIPGMKFNESELTAYYPNGAKVKLYGADNYDRLRGLYLDEVILDEYGDMDPRAWAEVIRPALADREGRATFIGTPKGQNDFYERCERAKTDPDWFFLELKASQTKLLKDSELQAARAEMTPDQYRQEFECDFDAAIPGAYYARTIRELEEAGGITSVPFNPALRVYTAWDIGWSDATAVWFLQVDGGSLNVIDYYEAQGEAADELARRMTEGQRARYNYAGHYLPHDAFSKTAQTGRSYQEALESLDIRPIYEVPNERVEDGINAARMLLPMCRFDSERTKLGVKALVNYRSEWDHKAKVLKPRPLHDWASHGADAFRYLALAYRKDWGGPQSAGPIQMPRWGVA